MTGAWIAIGLLLVGLPMLAWWVGGRRVWNRLIPGAEPDEHRDLARRHGLGPGDVVQVQEAVFRGREVADPRLRAAVVELAQRRAPARRSTARRWVTVLLACWVTAVVSWVGWLTAHGRWGDVNWVAAVWWIGGGALAIRRGVAVRRAVRLNSGPPGSGSADPGQRE